MKRQISIFVLTVGSLACDEQEQGRAGDGATPTPDGDALGDAGGASGAGNVRFAQLCVAGSFLPCGGDFSGSWRLVAGCTELADPTLGCSTAQLEHRGQISGTLELSAGGYAREVELALFPRVSLPSECSCPREAFGKTCLGCQCWGREELGWSGGASGASAVSSTADTVTFDLLGVVEPFHYCVQGERMTLVSRENGRYPSLKVVELERVR